MVFASHATADNQRLQGLFEKIRTRSPNFWEAETRIDAASDITLAVSQALSESSHLLICWSEAASKSSFVLDELSAFYMRNPQPDRILHLRMDATPILSLFAARKYLWFRDGTMLDSVAETILNWILGRNDLADTQEEQFNLPKPGVLHEFPLGPLVQPHPAMIIIANELTGVRADEESAMELITNAQYMRSQADPKIPERKILINMGMVSAFTAGILPFWNDVITQARLKGPRMLAALLLSQDDMFFSAEGKKARAELLVIMRKMWPRT